MRGDRGEEDDARLSRCATGVTRRGRLRLEHNVTPACNAIMQIFQSELGDLELRMMQLDEDSALHGDYQLIFVFEVAKTSRSLARSQYHSS